MLILGLALSGGQSAGSNPAQPRYSADGLYNLANSYARAGKPGLAVLNYERAALLATDDPDINANLDYVRAARTCATWNRPAVLHASPRPLSPTLSAWAGVPGVALVGVGLWPGRVAPRLRRAGFVGILIGARADGL